MSLADDLKNPRYWDGVLYYTDPPEAGTPERCEAGTGHVNKTIPTDLKCMCGHPLVIKQCVRCGLTLSDPRASSIAHKEPQ